MLTQDHNPIEVVLDAEAWLDPQVDLLQFDRSVHAAEDAGAWRRSVRLRVSGADATRRQRAQAQIELRYQRLSPDYNVFSNSSLFASVRACHRALHALDKPLVRADYDHALDVWQWTLRLSPQASLELQIAALFHDIERLESEADRRVEHTAADYLVFKQAHARRGASIVRQTLAPLPLPAERCDRVAQLVSSHEQPQQDAELALLNDADALSFFALNSPGFVRYYDAAHSAKKVAYTLSRMSAAARAWLPKIRLETKVAQLLKHAAAPHPTA
jgi:hypothetical protein